MAHSLSLVGDDRLADGFQIGNMIPTVIDDDVDAARARNRTTLRGYVALPNYRNYWVDAGYGDEMAAVAAALEAGDDDGVVAAMSDRWLDDCTLSGPVGRVRDGVEAWFDAGVTNPRWRCKNSSTPTPEVHVVPDARRTSAPHQQLAEPPARSPASRASGGGTTPRASSV